MLQSIIAVFFEVCANARGQVLTEEGEEGERLLRLLKSPQRHKASMRKGFVVVVAVLIAVGLALTATELVTVEAVFKFLSGIKDATRPYSDDTEWARTKGSLCRQEETAPPYPTNGTKSTRTIVRNEGSATTSGRLIFGPEPSQVLVLTACSPDTGYRDLSIKNKMLYAQLHQYDFRWVVEPFTLRKTPMWAKMVALLEGLGGGKNIIAGEPNATCTYEWIIWFDCDSLLTRYDMGIEEVAGEYLNRPDAQVLLGKDKNGWNSGVLALRCSDWNMALFKRMWAEPYNPNDVWAEQRILINFINSDPEVRDRVKLLPQERIQYEKYSPAKQVPEADEVKQFSLHFPGLSPEDKGKNITTFYHKIMEYASWINYRRSD